MISKCNPCHKKCLNSNETFYVKILNDCSYFIYGTLEYKINSKKVSKQSPVFRPTKTELLTFPSIATDILFTAYNCKRVPPKFLCTRVVPDYKSTCYKVVGYICIEIPC